MDRGAWQTTVQYYISLGCTTLYFYIHYNVLTTKILISTCHYTVLSLPMSPSFLPPLVTTTLFSVSTCLFLFGMFTFFGGGCLIFLYSTYERDCMVFVFSDLFHSAQYPQGPSM